MIRLVSYSINAVASIVLAGYFIREFWMKRLRASLAWGIGFLLFGVAVINLYTLAAIEMSKFAVYIGYIFSSAFISFLYYGASLLFFKEGSFFREKMAVIYFLIVLFIGWILTYISPVEQIPELGGYMMFFFVFIYLVISLLFYRVSRRVPEEDPRRRTLTLVALAWILIAGWQSYIGPGWGVSRPIEIAAYALGSLGFLLLLYGMTTGKTTKR